MRHRKRFAPLLLLSLLCAAACSQARQEPPLSEQNTRLVYPDLPPTSCARKPAVPAVEADDKAWALWKRADSDAGDDCRDKLDAIDAVVSKWPRAEK